ncbi:MAG: extracellular solute-binding protein [Eubacteriales bacterium]
MKKNTLIKIAVLVIVLITVAALVIVFGVMNKDEGGDDSKGKETITVYLWGTNLYDKYAPYIQSQLPDVDIQFVVGNNDLDFYKFMNENGKLPDIITSRRFSLHDAAALKDNLMDLSTTEQAGAVYDTYLQNFKNADGSVNWLPVCGEVDGFVANRALFEQYNIPLPTDYESLVSACKAFEEVGIRGFVADFAYDYTCMEILQGLSIPELTSLEGTMWRTGYADPTDTEHVGLDDAVWPGVFERMEQFIEDANVYPGDLRLDYTPIINMFSRGEVAIIRAGGSNVVAFQNMNVDAVFLPYFGQNGEQWLLTYPAFQIALNKDLESDAARKDKALQVLGVMLSEEGQNIISSGGDVISYSRNVNLELSPHLDNIKPIIAQNHVYIRIASNDFFSVSKKVVSGMISGEYNAHEAYEAFDAQLKQPKGNTAEPILTVDKDYSNVFDKDGGNEGYSVMANTLRTHYGSDVLIALCNSFTGSVFKAEYTEKMVSNMIMPNTLCSWQSEMTGAQLKELVRLFVEGYDGGITPFNLGSLPTFSGISVNVEENEGKYTLISLTKDGGEISDDEVFKVTTLSKVSYFGAILRNESFEFVQDKSLVKAVFTAFIKNGGELAEPTDYITVR